MNIEREKMRNGKMDCAMRMKYRLVCPQACCVVQITRKKKSRALVVESLANDEVKPPDVYP